MENLTLPRLLTLMLLDMYRWRYLLGDWYRAVLTFIVGLARAVDFVRRGGVLHG